MLGSDIGKNDLEAKNLSGKINDISVGAPLNIQPYPQGQQRDQAGNGPAEMLRMSLVLQLL